MTPNKNNNAEKAVLKFLKYAYKYQISREALVQIDPKILNEVGIVPHSLIKLGMPYFRKLITFLIIILFIGFVLFFFILVSPRWDLQSSRFNMIYEKFAKAIFAIYDTDPSSTPCLFESMNYYPIYNDLTRKPMKCDFCLNITGSKKLEKLTEKEFISYMAKNHPIVVTDAMNNWTAHKEFSFHFFKKLYTEIVPQEEFNLSSDDCQFFPYQNLEFDSLDDFFAMSEERARLLNNSDPWYIGWSNCWPTATKQLRLHYGRPYFLPKNSESTRTDWIFMGAVGYGADMHVDNVQNPSWQAQIKGIKIWKLVPPLECIHMCSSFDVEVNPGEIIVLDTNIWYHSTLIVGDEMSISIGSEFD